MPIHQYSNMKDPTKVLNLDIDQREVIKQLLIELNFENEYDKIAYNPNVVYIVKETGNVYVNGSLIKGDIKKDTYVMSSINDNGNYEIMLCTHGTLYPVKEYEDASSALTELHRMNKHRTKKSIRSKIDKILNNLYDPNIVTNPNIPQIIFMIIAIYDLKVSSSVLPPNNICTHDTPLYHDLLNIFSNDTEVTFDMIDNIVNIYKFLE